MPSNLPPALPILPPKSPVKKIVLMQDVFFGKRPFLSPKLSFFYIIRSFFAHLGHFFYSDIDVFSHFLYNITIKMKGR